MIYPNRKQKTTTYGYKVLLLFTAFFILCVGPQQAHAVEYIDSFVADITVSKDASYAITETIAYVFNEPRRGIFRCIPVRHPDRAESIFKERYIDISLERVTQDGETVPYRVEEKEGKKCIYIGDPNGEVINTHTYTIAYTVRGAVTYEEYGGADVYWNVNGFDWAVPTRVVEARVRSEDGLLFPARSCYRGAYGKTDSCRITTTDDGAVIFSGTIFGPHEGVTIAQSLDRARLAHDIRERYRPEILYALALLAAFCVLCYALYRFRTRHRSRAPIIAQYEPYPGIKPMYMGVLFDGRLDPQDITAGIIYLAEQGYLRITHLEQKVVFFFAVDDHVIELIKEPDEHIGAFEQQLLALLFHTGATIGARVSLSDLRKDYAVQRKNYQIITDLKLSLSKDLRESGFYEMKVYAWGNLSSLNAILSDLVVPIIVVCSAITILAIFFQLLPKNAHDSRDVFITFSIVVCVSVCVYALYTAFVSRRTKKGYEALDHLRGFKEYLSVTEKERYIFHNAPLHNAEQFMMYLPYAIALGVEKEWARSFSKITIPNPDWYQGTQAASFDALSLTESLSGFSGALAAASSTGGGGDSASSGGGFSGGGAGGGGGGSW